MEKMRRKIILFFVSYGRLFFYIMGVLLLIILMVQGLNKITIEQGNRSYDNINNEKEIKLEDKNETLKEKEFISEFITYCNEGNIENAYNMLSDRCKQEKYSNIEEFKSKYVNKIFNIHVCEYKVLKTGDRYKAIMIQDMLSTGKKNSSKEQIYQIDGVLERKIYIVN